MKAARPSNVDLARSLQMSKVRGKNTKPEWVVRRLVHGMGYRYRLHEMKLPGKPDLVFPKRRKVIFVHGCFWHQHDDPCCRKRPLPVANREFWKEKLERNVERDQLIRKELNKLGWNTMTIWECQTKAGTRQTLSDKIKDFLG